MRKLLKAVDGYELALYFPVAVAFVAELQDAIFGVVAFATTGADEVRAQVRALAVVVFRDGKSCPTTAGDEEHGNAVLPGSIFFGFAISTHSDSVTAAR